MRILIIEDEPLIRKSLKILLEKKGHQVDATAYGKEAIELLKINPYERVLLDLMLQDLNGFDIIETVRLYQSSEEIKNKFIIMTAYFSVNILDKAKSYGCPIWQKPFENIHKLLDGIINEKN